MINSISLKSIATFQEKIIIDELKKINFFYGSNGTGKTTISKVIANPENYIKCSVEWQNNKLKTIVFNEEFVREYFYEKNALQGIYTIGEEAKNIEEQIKNKNSEKDDIQKKVDNLQKSIQEKENEKSEIYKEFKEKCWKTGYQELQNDFDQFFTGYKKDKGKFADKILLKSNSNTSDLLELNQLKEKYDLLYSVETVKIDELQLIKIDDIEKVEKNQSILQTSIIGKKDVDIAKMIEKLHNHDWVSQGKKYYEANYDEEKNAYICPFCQQATSDSFKQQLEEYFDESYTENINELEKFINSYKTAINNIEEAFNNAISKENKYINEKKETLNDKFKAINSIIQKNNLSLEQKRNNPSAKISLESITSQLEEINKILEEVNEKIKEHNSLIDNRAEEKEKLEKQIWKFICDKLKNDIENYKKQENDIKKALEDLKKQETDKKNKIQKLNNEISELEKKIKSVKPTVKNINKLLSEFGFKGFSLKPTEDEKHYQVVRGDDTDAKKTLSEGERNFLGFLYFYHLVNGVTNPEENINENKIVVFDDPVSSLDSDVLFIVSTLVKNILNNIRENKGNIKQAFLLTHNAYFFKEITFISSRESSYNKRKDTFYYIVRKKDNKSYIDKHETNPIKTSYQLLWDDLKRENIDNISIQNSMRRIIEFYFKFLGNLNENDLLSKFEGEEKNICKSLISWINAGSHEIIDDYNISISDENIEKYKKVFEEIFRKNGQIAHHNMMLQCKNDLNNISDI